MTTRLFQKHGIEVVGFWEAVVGQSNTLYYMLRFRDAQHREEAWASFLADPEWQAARAASEANGPLVARIHNSLLRPTAYSPSV
ncbi:MAG: NIPSNAP family protein [Clostridia bacterium]|nr:NIPSNAP family protein [Clostridia bacterium]